MPPPVPPNVYAGRMMSGKRPIFSATARASARLWATPLMGTSKPMRNIASLNMRRSSPRSMAWALAPIISMPYFASVPRR